MSEQTPAPAAAAAEPPVTVERDGHVAIVRLNRPDKGNAYNVQMGNALNGALTACEDDDDVRVIVLTGAGKAFCVGLDLSGGASTFGDDGPLTDEDGTRQEKLVCPFKLRTPVIAALNGHAVGVGLTLAMQCDLRYVAEDAKLGFVFVRRGIVAEAYGHWTVPRTIGLAKTAELFFTGRTFSGREAAELGVVNAAMPTAEVLPAALAVAQEIAQQASPAAVALSKQLLWATFGMGPDEVYDAEVERIQFLGGSDEAKEGIRSFLERRPPEWVLKPSSDLPGWAYETR